MNKYHKIKEQKKNGRAILYTKNRTCLYRGVMEKGKISKS